MLAQQVHDADLLLLQVRDLNSGTFGFVQLARDKTTGELIACKFIERGDKVRHMLILESLSVITLRLPDVRRAVVVWSLGDQSCLGTDKLVVWLLPQVTKYVEREILNHRCLVHPHIVQFREVSATLLTHCCVA
jgi:serine/threonine-protein kinase SRK2